MKLESLSQKYPDICLPEIGEYVICGRSRITKLNDTRISKKHIKITVIDSDKIEILQLGSNNSSIREDSLILKRGHRASLSPASTFKFLEGTDYEYKFVNDINNSVVKNIEGTKQEKVKMNKLWSMGLLSSMRDSSLQLYKDELMVIIEDKYPKAKHHFLALPLENIASLKDLSLTHISLLEHIHQKAKEFMHNRYPGIEFKCGYHAIPSMTQVHCHVISKDFNSPCLKNKKHWNSFNTPFFIEANELVSMLKSDHSISLNPNEYNLYLKATLKCNKCEFTPSNMPKLKEHLFTCHANLTN